MRVLVLGASGGSGRAAVAELLARGHEVTAFLRQATGAGGAPRLHTFVGDARDAPAVERAVRGQDAVVIALGIRENPLLVRLRGSSGTSLDIRSTGTRHVIGAMRKHGIARLVVQTTYGAGASRRMLPLKWRLIFSILLQPQIDDTEQQERLVRGSGLDWVIAQPVSLTGVDREARAFASPAGEVRGMTVSRESVARFLADAVETPRYVRQCVALSADPVGELDYSAPQAKENVSGIQSRDRIPT